MTEPPTDRPSRPATGRARPRRLGGAVARVAVGALVGGVGAPALLIIVADLASVPQDLGILAWIYGAALVGLLVGAAVGAAVAFRREGTGPSSRRTWTLAAAAAMLVGLWVTMALGF